MRYLPLVALCVVAACTKPPEEETIDLLNEMADVLEDVKDRESAEAAKPKLQKIANRLDELEKEVKGTEPPPEMQKKAADAMQRLMGEMMRVMQNPETAEPLQGLDVNR